MHCDVLEMVNIADLLYGSYVMEAVTAGLLLFTFHSVIIVPQ